MTDTDLANGMAPGMVRAAGMVPEAAPAIGTVHAGLATGMARANTPVMARRRVRAAKRSTAEAGRQRRRRLNASTVRDHTASPTTDNKGRVHLAFFVS